MSQEKVVSDFRLERIERALERLLADHEQFRHDQQQLLTTHLLHNESIKRYLRITQENSRQIEEQGKQIEEQGLQIDSLGVQSRQRSDGIDLRIERLISAFGEFIRRTPTVGP